MHLLVVLALTGAALAADPPAATSPAATSPPPAPDASTSQTPARPCAPDLERHCKDVAPGARRLMGCLIAHRTELTPACQKRIAGVKQRREVYEGPKMDAKQLRACRPDIEARCLLVSPGRGRWLDCLHDNETQLSAACRTELARTSQASASTPAAGAGAVPTGVPTPPAR
jgi:hypothetical protein